MTEHGDPRDLGGLRVPAGRDAYGDRPPPPRFAFDRHTWKEIAHLLLNLPVSLVGFTYVVTVLFTSAWLTVTVIGFPLLAAALMGARLLGRAGRARARALLGGRVDEPSRVPLCGSFGCGPQSGTAGRGPGGSRAMLCGPAPVPWGVLTFPITGTSLCVLWPVLPYRARGMADVGRAMVRGLLLP